MIGGVVAGTVVLSCTSRGESVNIENAIASDSGTGSDAGSGSGSGSGSSWDPDPLPTMGSGSCSSGSGDPGDPSTWPTTQPEGSGSGSGSGSSALVGAGAMTGTGASTALACSVAGTTGADLSLTSHDIVGMPAGCCDTAPPTAGINTCWANSPMGQCGAKGAAFGLPPTNGSCIGLWTRPPTFDSALKYCMCMTMPNGACYNNVRACLACANGTHSGGQNPAPPFHAGTGFPAGGCFVIPVAELFCYNNVGCTFLQQLTLANAVSCQLPVCTGWATAQCLRAGTC